MARKMSKKSAKLGKKIAAVWPAVKPTLLVGVNVQIAKADDDALQHAYIAAMPGRKRDVGCRFTAIIVGVAVIGILDVRSAST